MQKLWLITCALGFTLSASQAFAETVPAKCDVVYNDQNLDLNVQVTRNATGPGTMLFQNSRYEFEINLYTNTAVISMTTAQHTLVSEESMIHTFAVVDFEPGETKKKHLRLQYRSFIDTIEIACEIN